MFRGTGLLEATVFMKRHTLLFLLLSIAAGLFAASDIRFRTIKQADGLSSNQVNTVFRDSHGFVWFGTASGLNRFDGYGIRNFQSSRSDTTRLHDNYVQTIQEFDSVRLLVRAGDKYTLFNPRTEKFHRLDTDYFKSLGVPGYPNLIRVRPEGMWIAMNSKGIYFHPKRPGAKTIHLGGSLANSEITDIAFDRHEDILAAVSNTGEFFTVDLRNLKMTGRHKIPVNFSPKASYSIFIDNSHRAWVYSLAGCSVFNLVTGKWESSVGPSLKGRSVKSINQDDSGRLWIGYDGEGLEIINPDGSSEILTADYNDPTSLGNNSIYNIYRDVDNGMWVATYKRGVSVHYPSEYKFTTVAAADVNCIMLPTPDSPTVYLGTDHTGIMTYDYRSGAITPFSPGGMSSNPPVVCMTRTSDGFCWAGTYKDGLIRWGNGSPQHYTTADGLPSDNIWSLQADPDGSLWIGTLGDGVAHYDPATGKFEKITSTPGASGANYINTMCLGKDGLIYLGTADGVWTLDRSSHKIAELSAQSRTSDRYRTLSVNQVYFDSHSLLWIGTREGLYVYDPAEQRYYDVLLQPNQKYPFIQGIIEGKDNSIWVTSESYLYNISVKRDAGGYQFAPYAFGPDDGMTEAAFNQRSLCRLPDGVVLAGNLDGILVIDPAKISGFGKIPHVRFDELYVRTTFIEPGEEYDGRVILKHTMEYTDRIVLAHDQNDITIGFSTDSYISSHKGEYEYMLEGYDDSWRKCRRGQHSVSYTNIPPGTYRLKVRLNIPGIPSADTERVMVIKVLPPWYETWWMITIYVVLFFGAILWIIISVRARERRKYLEQRKEERQKRQEEINQLKFKFFTNISHDLRTPLTLILSPVDSMLGEPRSEQDAKRLNIVRRNAQRLLYLVNQLLDFRKNEMAGLTLNATPGDICSTIEKARDNFIDMADRRNIELQVACSPGKIRMDYDNDKITKVVMNLLSNAVKYTPEGGGITVSAKEKGDDVEIVVADTGRGISDEDKKHIFERFYMGTGNGDSQTGTGIGLSLVYEYVRLHGGTVTVEDNTPNGTKFIITLPRRHEIAQPAPDTHKAENAEAEADASPAMAQAPIPSRPTVLLVDDNPDLVEFLRDEFSDKYNILTASNGVEGLEKLKGKRVDLVVSDIMMPVMDGIQMARAMRSEPATASIPLIMLTAKQDVSSVIQGLTIGADDYVTKPFNNDVLALKIRRLLALRDLGIKRPPIEPAPSEIQITSLDRQLVEKAVKFVEENMDDPNLTVERLSAALGMSRVNLYKKLLPLTGKTPIEFIRVLRLKRAAQYLRESQLNISEIAYKVGFNTPKYFSKYFRAEYGVSPSDYQHREELEG